MLSHDVEVDSYGDPSTRAKRSNCQPVQLPPGRSTKMRCPQRVLECLLDPGPPFEVGTVADVRCLVGDRFHRAKEDVGLAYRRRPIGFGVVRRFGGGR